MALIWKESLVRRKFVNVPKLPNVVQKLGNKKKVLIPAVIVLVLAGGFGVHALNRQKAKKAMAEQMSQVETTQVTKQNLIDSISVTGTIASADARDVSAIASNVKVKTVNYKVGDYVNAGDVVAVLDSSELERKLTEAQNSQALSEYNENKSIETASNSYTQAVEDGTDDYNKAVKSESQAKEDLQDAEDDLSSAASTLKKREKSLSAAKEALSALSDPTESYTAAANALESAKSTLADAQTALAKLEETDPGYADAKAAVDTAQQAVDAAQATYDSVSAEKATYDAAVQAVNNAQAAYTEAHQAYTSASDAEAKASDSYETASDNLTDASKNNDRNISNAANSLEKAQKEKEYSNNSSDQTIDDYEEQIAACMVTAPISGIITAMEVSEGDTYLGEGKTIFSIADNENFIVSASVDEYDISSISEGMTAAVIVEALGEDELPAKVSFVSPTASTSSSSNGGSTGSASYSLEIALDDSNTDLRIGMTAKASIVKEAVYDVLTLPYDCVTTDEDGNSSVTIDKDGEKTQIPVTLGMQSDYYVEISGENIEEGTTVYYNTPMVNNSSSGDMSSDSQDGVTFDMGGGNMGGGPGGGGNPGGGGAPGGGAGGF